MQNSLTIDESDPHGSLEFQGRSLPAVNEQKGSAFQALIPARLNSLLEQHRDRIVSLLAIFDQAIVSGTSFLTAAIIGRSTSTDHLGMFFLLLTAILLITGIHEQVAICPYFIYSKREKGSRLAEYSGSFWVHQLILIGGAVLALVGTIAVLAGTGLHEYEALAWALLCAVPLLMLRNSARRFGHANLRVIQVIALDALVASVQLVGLVLLAYYERLTLLNIYALIGGANGLACLAWYFMDTPQVRFNRRRIWRDWLKNWSFGKWALRSYLVGDITPHITLWTLGAFAGAAATGLFGGCSTIVKVGNIVLIGVSNILTAQASSAFVAGGPQQLKRVLWKTLGLLALAIGAVCLLVLATGDKLPVLVFGSEFGGTGGILLLLALSMLITCINTVSGIGLWALDRPNFNFIADVCGFVFTVLALLVLIAPWGALGAAWAILVGTTGAAVVRAFTFRRHLGMASPRTAPSASDASLRPSES